MICNKPMLTTSMTVYYLFLVNMKQTIRKMKVYFSWILKLKCPLILGKPTIIFFLAANILTRQILNANSKISMFKECHRFLWQHGNVGFECERCTLQILLVAFKQFCSETFPASCDRSFVLFLFHILVNTSF